MNLALHRLALLVALFLPVILPSRAGAVSVSGTFQVGSSGTSAYPFYAQSPYNNVPVGKTLVLPIVVSGSGPLTYTATSTSPYVLPIIKTGYPVMKIHVTYSGTTGTLSTLYSFTGGADGGSPYAGLVSGTGGLLYGTATADGTSGNGTVYQITTSGSLTPLHSFTGGADGGTPIAGLITGTGGNLYGTTEYGGIIINGSQSQPPPNTTGLGTVYNISASGSLSTLYSFGASAGSHPVGGLVTGTDGNLYGTTKDGGRGYGTVFQLSKTGTSFATLYSFTGGVDGANPQSTLVQGSDGSFYGTTVAGGSSSAGTVFRITTSGSLTTLHSFSGGADGGSPYGGLISGSGGIVYGTTETGGTGGFGTVYVMTTTGTVGTLETLHSFSGADGANPYAGVILASDGNLYGTTETDGTSGFGTVYQLATSGSFATLYSFSGGITGGNPRAPLVEAGTGDLFGTTVAGGSSNHGTIFQIPIPNAGQFSGTMSFALFRDLAPTTTGYIAGFAQAGYYNGLDFFRITNLDTSITNGFIAQGGDPSNTGTGNPGFAFDNEFSPSLIFTGQGQLAMANSGENSNTFRGTNGSQFFFTQGPIRHLDYGYTIFGQLLSGFDIMQHVMSVPLKSTTDGSTPSAPAAPVVMDSVTVSEDDTDAILFVNGAGYLPNGATINVSAANMTGTNDAIVVSGTNQTPGLSISVTASNDSIDDPPYMVPYPNVNAPLRQSVSLPIRAVDLEFDYLITDAFSLSFFSSATVALNSNVTVATVRPSASSPVTSLPVGMDVQQGLVSTERSSALDLTAVNVALGVGRLTPLPALLTGTAGGPIAASTSPAAVTGTTFGAFLVADTTSSAADFTPVINWGDGTLTSGSASVFAVRSAPSTYSIVAPSGHTYANPGIYPVNVTVTGSSGGIVEVQNTAVVSSGPIYPQGRTFAAAKGLANGLIATFVDHSPNVNASDYQATINWGDGSVKAGNGMVRGSNGHFQVYGKHQYKDGSSYPVDVTINATNNPTVSPGYAWSVAKLSGIASHEPPYAQSHVNGQISNPGFNGLFLSEEVTLFNSGDLPSGPVSLRFYLSPDSNTSPINSAAIPLAVGKGSTYNTPSIAAGSAIEGAVSQITLPSNAVTRNKFIIMQVITSDPIANHMPYPHAFADPFPLIE